MPYPLPVEKSKKRNWTELFLTFADLERIEIALRLRVEACEDDSENADMKKDGLAWKRILTKVQKIIAKAEEPNE